MGNPLLAIGDAVPARIAEAREERDRLIGRVLELNQEIATLETVRQVAPARMLGEPAGPVVEANEGATNTARRRPAHRDPPEPSTAGSPA